MNDKRTKSKKPEQNEEKFCTKSREQKSPPGIRFSNGQFTGFSERCWQKNAFLKQYEKFCTFLRNELCSNNLCDFGLKKGLEHLEAVREKFLAITDRFAGLQAQG